MTQAASSAPSPSSSSSSSGAAAGHRVLIVEDDPIAAEMLEEIIVALGDRPHRAATVEDALAALADEDFCYALVDQELPSRAGARPLEGGGERVMTAMRAKDNRRHDPEGFHVTPIVVVTGFAGDSEFVSRMYDVGADAFFLKPIHGNVGKLRDKIRVGLERAKRIHHDRCALYALRAPGAAEADGASRPGPERGPQGSVRLVLDGLTRGGSTSFLVNDVRTELQDAKFGVLLRFVAALLASPGAMSPKASLGLTRSRDATTRVRKAFAGLVPDGFEVIEGDRRGQFRLNPQIVVERADWEAMAKHPDATVQKIALEQLSRRKKGR